MVGDVFYHYGKASIVVVVVRHRLNHPLTVIPVIPIYLSPSTANLNLIPYRYELAFVCW